MDGEKIIMSLPANLKRFFWEIDPNNLDLQKYGTYIIKRIFEYGDDEAVRWIVGFYGQNKLKEVLSKSRGISPKTANFWRLLLNLKSKDILCLTRSYREKVSKFWKY